jgi:NADP-dependent 3-hydroxy acid dehydrogenase YdfG
MDFSSLPDDFFVTSSQYTNTVHRDIYPAIDPTLPALSQKGKVIIITGASQGLGRHVSFLIHLQPWLISLQAFAASFAKAGSATIVLIARNIIELEAAAKEIKAINPEIKVLTESADIRDKESVQRLFAKVKNEVGTADVLINNAGTGSASTPIRDIGPDDFWNAVVCLRLSPNHLLLLTRHRK